MFLQLKSPIFNCKNNYIYPNNMKTLIDYFKRDKNFILFLFIFSWVLTLKKIIGIANSWEDIVFYPDTPFWVFLNALLIFMAIRVIKKWMSKNTAQETPSIRKYLMYFGLGFICYMFCINLFGGLISIAFNTISRNFGSLYQVSYNLFNQTLDFTIFGGFSLAYLYALENREFKKKLSLYKITNSKSKIQQLKAQLNPHFLFNNLNILDQLIEEDQEKASDFLSRFAELYRYALKSSDKELISIQEEVTFAKNYFKLMEEKYQGYYQLDIKNSILESNTIVPPFCLQVLIENAIAHNLGSTQNPVLIKITLENGIKVTNNRVPHTRIKKGNGVALKNLSKQFELLTNKPLSIEETKDYFAVTLPLIKMNNYD